MNFRRTYGMGTILTPDLNSTLFVLRPTALKIKDEGITEEFQMALVDSHKKHNFNKFVKLFVKHN